MVQLRYERTAGKSFRSTEQTFEIPDQAWDLPNQRLSPGCSTCVFRLFLFSWASVVSSRIFNRPEGKSTALVGLGNNPIHIHYPRLKIQNIKETIM